MFSRNSNTCCCTWNLNSSKGLRVHAQLETTKRFAKCTLQAPFFPPTRFSLAQFYVDTQTFHIKGRHISVGISGCFWLCFLILNTETGKFTLINVFLLARLKQKAANPRCAVCQEHDAFQRPPMGVVIKRHLHSPRLLLFDFFPLIPLAVGPVYSHKRSRKRGTARNRTYSTCS